MIECALEGRVLRIALNRPEKRNALNIALCRELVDAFDEAAKDPAVGAILLAANGPSFCAGMDLSEVAEVPPPDLAEVHERLFTTIDSIRKPVVAAVHGAALAGGTGLVANAHIAVASPDARFGLTEIRIALWPVLVFRAVALAIGERRATEWSLTGRTIDAEEALRSGLISAITPGPAERAREIAAAVSEYSAGALGAGLDYVHQIRHMQWDEAGRAGGAVRDRLMSSADFKLAVDRFLKKR